MRPNSYLVVNENVLGYTYSHEPDRLWILRASVIRGASHLSGTTRIGANDVIRKATLKDFEDFGVQSNGHI